MTSSYGSERRRSQRFGLALPLDVIRISDRDVSVSGRTRNVSSSGACFVVGEPSVSIGSPIEFIVTLRNTQAEEERIRLRCRGRVTRSEKAVSKSGTAVAATIDRYQFLRGLMN